MKSMLSTAAILVLLCGSASVHAAEMSGGGGQTATAPVHKGSGVIKGLDAAKGTIVLAHEPVPALKWPAMTMPFKIGPEIAKGLMVGQRVEFEFHAKDMNGTIIRIKVLP